MGPRRVLNVPRVLIVGALLGMVLGAIVGVREPRLVQFSESTEVGFFTVLGGIVGVFLGAVVIAIGYRRD